MSANNGDDEVATSRSAEELESPRKRMRLENSSRKSWSLMDRRTDQEVLQEMGVSLLEPDEFEPQCDTPSSTMHHKTMKRKRNIENVNPNVNSIMSPRSKYSPRSPKSRVKCSPSPGSSKAKSPRSLEKMPLQQADLETTLLEDYLMDSETPLVQLVPAHYCSAAGTTAGTTAGSTASTTGSPRGFTALCLEEEQIISRLTHTPHTGVDSFSALSDEMILSVFKWLPKLTLSHCMLVCKRWYQVACDETLWQRLDLGNKTLAKNALGRILARKPTIIRLANSEIGEWTPQNGPQTSRVQYLDLSMTSISTDTLVCLLSSCPGLKKLSLENGKVTVQACQLIGQCKNLETLNLTMAQGITEEGLSAILDGCQSLLSLNISWCSLSEEVLNVLVTSLPPTLQRLNLGGSRLITDEMVGKLVILCPRLLELDLSDCPTLAVDTITNIQTLSRLDHLALSRCYLLPPNALMKLNSMPSLQFLDIWGMLPTKSLNALRAALPAIQVNQFMFSAIARPTVGAKRTSIWGLRTRD